jgi:hypothetical protein
MTSQIWEMKQGKIISLNINNKIVGLKQEVSIAESKNLLDALELVDSYIKKDISIPALPPMKKEANSTTDKILEDIPQINLHESNIHKIRRRDMSSLSCERIYLEAKNKFGNIPFTVIEFIKMTGISEYQTIYTRLMDLTRQQKLKSARGNKKNVCGAHLVEFWVP